MAFYCIDYINGSDVTGDGTASAPWKTIEYGATQINGGAGYVSGDEMRIAGSTKSASLGTITFASRASSWTIFNTSTDLTADLAVNDVVQFGGAIDIDGGSGDLVLQVYSITPTQIGLFMGGTTSDITMDQLVKNGVNYDIYKITDVVNVEMNSSTSVYADRPNQVNSAFDAWSDSVVISGGWDKVAFTSKTAYGRTAFARTGTYGATGWTSSSTVFTSTAANRFNGFKFKDFAVARLHINRDGSGYMFGCNYENYSNLGNTEFSSTTTAAPASPFTRTATNCTWYAGRIDDMYTPNVAAPYNFVNCTFLRSSKTAPMYPGYINILSARTFTNCTMVSKYSYLGSCSVMTLYPTYTSTATTDVKGQIVDFNSPTIISECSHDLADGGEGYSQEQTLNLTSSFLSTNNIVELGASRWAGQTKIVTDDIEGICPISISRNLSGPIPSTVTDTSTGLTWDILGGKLLGRLNNVDNNTGTNCIELKSIDGVMEGPFVPFAFERGATITLEIVGKIKGATTSFTPAIRVAGADGSTTVATIYNPFDGLENMSITGGGSYNNSTWTTSTYQLTGALSSGSYPEYSAQFALYSGDLTDSDSFLIDSITWTIS